MQDVKFALHTIMDKLVGNHPEPYSTEEIEILIFAFESNILFDNVAHKFLPSLQKIIEFPSLDSLDMRESNRGDTDLKDEVQLRNTMVKTILITVIKENIFREISIRFGS
ncbi:hypothetical protein NZ043_29465 [Paenibacillus sp. FSL k6-2145]|uniref:hypothetical protein n=2 Tax=Paenibacillus TaxID=44249 RepID=UPI0030DB2FAF